MALGMMGETPVLDTIFHTEINGLDSELDDILDREQKRVLLDQPLEENGLTDLKLGRLQEQQETDVAELTAAGQERIIDSDVLDYLETVSSRNAKLEGISRPVTGVPFMRYQVEMDGKPVEIVAPKFESISE